MYIVLTYNPSLPLPTYLIPGETAPGAASSAED